MRERRSLEARPWEEELLHWARDGTLHGTVSPPSDGRRRSTTADGWCPGWALELQRKFIADNLGPIRYEDAAESAESERED